MSRANNLRIYFQDEHLVVIEKPAGFHVHTPEYFIQQGKSIWKNNITILLRKQLDREIYPVHRLDRATGGVMVFALSSEIAKELQNQFKSKTVKKNYVCLVRGWTEDQGIIDSPLTTGIDEGELVEARTDYQTLYRFDLPHPVGKFERGRYSIVSAFPLTGKMHQIRRHFKRISHPLIGDTVHGDGQHNRLWRELLKQPGGAVNYLFLKAYVLEFKHPITGENLKFRTRWNKTWLRMFDQAGACPMIIF